MITDTMVNSTTGVQTGPRQRIRNNKGADDMLSLRDILDIFLANWKWFLLSAIVCVVLARVYLASQLFVFQRQAVMLVKDDASGTTG